MIGETAFFNLADMLMIPYMPDASLNEYDVVLIDVPFVELDDFVIRNGQLVDIVVIRCKQMMITTIRDGQDLALHIVAAFFIRIDTDEAAFLFDEPVDTVAGSDPYIPLAVLVDGCDVLVGDGKTVVCVMSIMCEGIPIETVQSILCTHP
jgi:hypothetical protein